MTTDAYVTRKEAADILGISLGTLDKMIEDGRLPVVRPSERIVRIARVDLEPDAIRARMETT